MARAFYDESDPLYRAIREESAEQSPKKLLNETKAFNADHPKFEVVREALDNAKELSLAGYEFLAIPRRNEKRRGTDIPDKTDSM